jgi:hypothetical protein
VQDNPLGAKGHSQGLRQIVVAVMPQLRLLNGSEITKRERANAERFYLSLFLKRKNKEKTAGAEGGDGEGEDGGRDTARTRDPTDIADVLAAVDPAEKHRTRLQEIHGEGFAHGDDEASSNQAHFATQLIEITLQPVAPCIISILLASLFSLTAASCASLSEVERRFSWLAPSRQRPRTKNAVNRQDRTKKQIGTKKT